VIRSPRLAALLTVLSIGLSGSPAAQNRPASAATSSVWDGVYSEEQARRGEALYGEKCASCHLDDLTGYEYAPPLTIDYFVGDWGMAAHTVAEVFEKIRKTMPKEAPGSLTESVSADVLAYIFHANHLPSGPAALSSDRAVLARIRITANPPRSR
jgi:quinoprotein glucose dehydrogenase